MDKPVLGLLSVVLLIVGYIPYFYSIFKKRTKPHVFTWLIWTLVNSIAFGGQFVSGAGAGSWALGLSTFMCIGVAFLGVLYGEKHITRGDKTAFAGAVAAIILWLLTHDPLGSMLLLSLIDFLGAYPTMRKSFANPYGENVFSWSVHAARVFIVVMAVEHYSPTTLIFPLENLLSTTAIAAILLWGRRVRAHSI